MTIEPLHDDGEPVAGSGSPPYSSCASFVRQFESFREQGQLPARFDRSFYGNASGGLVSQNRKTLGFFGLIDEEYRPTTMLRHLVDVDEDTRKSMLRGMVEDRYRDELALAANSGTTGQLLEIMRERGLTGATGRKAATFFIHICDYVGLPVSPFFSQPKATASNGGTTTRRRRKKPEPVAAEAPAAVAAVPDTSPEGQKARYVEMLMDMAKESGEGGPPPSELLDRIERMLGQPPAPQPEREGNQT